MLVAAKVTTSACYALQLIIGYVGHGGGDKPRPYSRQVLKNNVGEGFTPSRKACYEVDIFSFLIGVSPSQVQTWTLNPKRKNP